MLEALEMRLAAQRAHVATFQTRLASRFVNGRRDRVARDLAVAQIAEAGCRMDTARHPAGLAAY